MKSKTENHAYVHALLNNSKALSSYGASKYSGDGRVTKKRKIDFNKDRPLNMSWNAMSDKDYGFGFLLFLLFHGYRIEDRG